MRLEQTDSDDVDDGLYALISVHLRKEEDIQVPAFDAASPEVPRPSSSAWRR